MFKKFIAIVTSVCACLTFFTVSVSANTLTAAGSVSSTFELTMPQEGFAIQVPTSIPVTVAYDGTCTVASNATIKNLSSYPIEIASIKIYDADASGSVTLVDWANTLTNTNDDELEFAFKLNDAYELSEAVAQDSKSYRELTYTGTTLADSIASNSSLSLTYAMVCEPYVISDGACNIGGVVFVFQKATV